MPRMLSSYKIMHSKRKFKFLKIALFVSSFEYEFLHFSLLDCYK